MRAAAAFVVAGFLAVPALASAQNCTSDARQVVDAIYRQVLERGAGGGEANTWITQLSSGQTTVRELVENIAGSAEHRQRFLPGESEGSRRNAVTLLYRHLLGREPDPGGLEAHVDLHNRNDVDAVIASLISSRRVPAEVRRERRARAERPLLRQRGTAISAGSATWTATATTRSSGTNGTAHSSRSIRTTGTGTACCRTAKCGRARAAGRTTKATSIPTGRRPGRRARSGGSTGTTTAGWCPTKWYYAPEYFRRADRDRNGALSQTEFVYNATWDDDRDDRFQNLDMNNNGRVERSEWHGSADAFQWLDRNNDNVLSQAEVVGDGSTQFDGFASLDRNGNGRLEAREWQWSVVSFNRYDTNNDDFISRQEFTARGGAPRRAGKVSWSYGAGHGEGGFRPPCPRVPRRGR